MADDPFRNTASPVSGPASDGFAVVPSDTENFAIAARALYVGGSGDVTLVTVAGSVLLFSNVPPGALLPIRCSRVDETGTTATNIIGLY